MAKKPLATSIYEGPSARQRLRSLWLDPEGLADVIRRGERARAEETDYDAQTYGGNVAYYARVRALRETYCPRSWTPLVLNGLELIQSADKKIGIITRSGDSGVGDKFALKPQPSGKVGGGAAVVVGQNPRLFAAEWFASSKRGERPKFEVWMLLVNYSEAVVKAELSLPTAIDDEKVDDWIERILLPDFDPNDPEGNQSPGDDLGDLSIDVPVTRKK